MLTATVIADFNRPDGDGSPASGTVTFRPSVRLVHTGDGDIIVNSPVAVTLVGGLIDVDLPATDDPDLEPAGWTWHVTEHINGVKRGYSMLLAAGTTVDLATVAPIDPVSPAATYVSASTAITTAALREIVEDIVGSLVADAPLVDFTYDDATGALTATVIGLTSANLSDFAEAVRDRMAATLVAGPNVTVTVDDPGDTITIGLTGVATDIEVAEAVTAHDDDPDAHNGTLVPFASLAADPDLLIVGAVTRDADGAATSAAVEWPDGTPGLYTGTPSADFPGAIDAYTVTYGSPASVTYTQPAVTRDSDGAVTVRPAVEVS